MKTEVYVVGAGGHAKVVVAALQAMGERNLSVLDDDASKAGSTILGVPVRGPVAELLSAPHRRAVLAVGHNATRKRLAERLQGVDWLTVVDPSARVHGSVRLGPGSVVFAGATIQPDAILGSHVIVNTGATVDHDCVLADYVHVAPGAHVAGGVRLEEGVFLGIGSVAVPEVTIGAWTTVGAGAAVISNLPPGITAVGVPARPRGKPDG
jgi:sugar O-acyltransferase (sialic acid O-acetyltransferase NeuD family)